ncbi:ATP-binding protein [Trichocoleus sp. FACHB-46]|nr:ATP-binding protein [Trichocoleus sp. FACHB-46]
MDSLIKQLGKRFGVLAESDTYQLTVVAENADVAVGDLFLLPSRRGGQERFYIFRTTQYANIMNRALEIDDIARNKLTMPDSYLSQNLAEELLIKLTGIVLGYAEAKEREWTFHKPRRLPEHLSNVFRVDPQQPEVAEVMRSLLASQLGDEGLYVGDLLAGEQALEGVKVFLPAYALSHHLGVFGRTGAGKSNLMMVLLKAVMDYNQAATQQKSQEVNKPLVSMLAIDPHDEFRFWHGAIGGKDGVHGIVKGYSSEERKALVEPFYYLTAREVGEKGLERQVMLSRADVLPDDLSSISEFSEQQVAFAQQQFALWGEQWIGRVLLGDTQGGAGGFEGNVDFLSGTVAAVQRRLSFLRRGQTRLFLPFDPDVGYEYESLLPEILCALERGRILIVDTTLMGEMEQFLLTTVVARSLFTLRRTLRSVARVDELPRAIREAFGNDDEQGQVGLRTLADDLVQRVEDGRLPYGEGGVLKSPDQLPYVNVVVEEAPSVLNPQRMKFGSVFRDISRQGRKFGIGLTVVSQQVSEIDDGVLSQINTELVMALGNELERKEAVRNASADLSGFERELQVMGKGQVIVSASYKDVPLPVQVPEFDQME